MRNTNILVSASILSSDFSALGDEVKKVAVAGADMIHLDIMDGHFVPNITFGPAVVKSIRNCANLPFDCHLMIEKPEKYLKNFRDAGCNILTVQAETCPHLQRILAGIRDLGMKSGVALNPSTPPDFLDYVLDVTDLVLVMTVNPGFGGQNFIKSTVPKIKKIREMIDKSGREIYLEVDGGIDPETSPVVADAGANLLVSGSAIFQSKNYADVIKKIKNFNY